MTRRMKRHYPAATLAAVADARQEGNTVPRFEASPKKTVRPRENFAWYRDKRWKNRVLKSALEGGF